MAIKVVLSPKLPAPLVEIARSVLPADFDLQVVDQGTPEFDAAIKDAEYLTGFTRSNMGAGLLPWGAEAQADPADQRRLRPARHRGGAPGARTSRQQRRLELGRGGRTHADADPGRLQEARVAPQQRRRRQVAGRRLRPDAGLRAGREDARHRRP